MDTAGYVALTRQSGLIREMGVVANNIANGSTVGFRREGVVFSEYVARLRQEPSVSMAFGNARHVDLFQAALEWTGGSLDLAIQGDGFFMVQTPEGARLTRAGSFTLSAEGELVTPEGFALLDAGGAPLLLPPNPQIAIAADGTITVDGEAAGQIGLWQPVAPEALTHRSGALLDGGEVAPAEGGRIRQGFLEQSNVNPVTEIARMVAIQRAYEMGQKFLDAEDSRCRNLIQILGGTT